MRDAKVIAQTKDGDRPATALLEAEDRGAILQTMALEMWAGAITFT
jgi:hypothetical protein